ncbi:Mce protein [Mycolicibacterium helvum]|uniref:Mce associated membrane protein n=1 Tax=Mycolicibacterium helvum TaxID=1534349 RepID=A0A7I7T4J6_9MYCO|nr:Mce protein [Mycolicibacterium helvum]BBY63743.1 Mce associated membrane protein [Mycolicibacterium helvum]
MEDQQPTAGDLTDGASDREVRSEAVELGVAETASESATEESPKARKRFSPNKKTLAVGVSAALFVAAGAFAGATVQPYLMDRATVDTKLTIARTAAEAITTLWTYTPDDMDKLPDRSAKYLSGDFEDQYRKYVDAIVPTNKQAKVTNSTEVVGAAVESLNGSDATAIVYTNTTSKSPLSKDIPSTKYLSYRVQLTREGSHWLVTKMTTVTSLDLTPRL